MSRQLVGLIGRKRSGKDSFASVLVEEFGFRRVAFADPLKSAALDLDPIIRGGARPRLADVVAAKGWESTKDKYPEARRTLQRLGVAIRNIDPDFWLRAALAEIDRDTRPVVVTDVRFPNEAEKLAAMGAHLIRIERPSSSSSVDLHVSETALDGYVVSLHVANNGTLDDLRSAARAAARSFGT